MRRRRQQLQVSTFPFLAVLLCAMGALILVLLSMDRTAKKAALAKAQDEANETIRGQYDAHGKLVAQRQHEVEGKKRIQRQSWEKKRDALSTRVSAEEQALEKELAAVQARLAEAARKLRDEEGGLAELSQQFEREKALLARQEEAVASARRQATGAAKQLSASDRTRSRLSAELARLEKSLAEQVERRKKDAQTFSVIPYHGKRGESRRPIYVECNASGLLFHPEKKSLSSADDLRGELKKRIDVQKARLASAGLADARPYVMLLVRPDGVGRYYEMQAASRDLGIDFGYEFVEASWVLHFPEDDAPKQPWMATAPPLPASDAKPTPSGVRGVPSTVANLPSTGHSAGKPSMGGTPPGTGLGSPVIDGSASGQGTGTGPALGSATTSVPAGGGNPGGGSPGLFAKSGDGLPALPPIESPAATLSPPTFGQTGRAGSGSPSGDRVALGSPSGTGTGQGGKNGQGNVDGNLDTGVRTLPAPKPNEGIAPPSVLPNLGGGGTGTGTAGVGQGQPGTSSPPRNEDRIGPSLPDPDSQRKPPLLRPARIGGGESIVFVECKDDTVIIYPSRRRIAVEALNHSPAYNPLVQAVRQQVQRRQGQSGEPVKVQVRFLVNRDGERTFHLAYPCLEALKLTMSRYALQPWDDVNRIVAEY